jgi:predicted nicotinamide N-methyase
LFPSVSTFSNHVVYSCYSWRAAEHLCQYIIDHPEVFSGKSVCEVGSGLGLVSILLEKLAYCSELIVTDGDEDTLSLLIENKIDNDCLFDTSYLLWGEHDDFLSDHSSLFDILIGADIIYEEEQILPLLQTVSALMKSKFYDFSYSDCCLTSLI